MRISDWSSDVCSSDLAAVPASAYDERLHEWQAREALARSDWPAALAAIKAMGEEQRSGSRWTWFAARLTELTGDKAGAQALYRAAAREPDFHRSEEHTSELTSLMRTSYAVLCLKNKNTHVM